MPWTDERVTTLKDLWDAGFSASQIARQMGDVTRNAVIGKIHRLGLAQPKHPKPVTDIKPPRPRTPRRNSKPHDMIMASLAGKTAKTMPWSAIETPPLSDADIPIAQRRTFDQLRPHHCKWPVGDPSTPDFFYCGAARVESAPYCAAHCRIAYQPSSARRGAVIPMRRAA